jgi:hypothetical protein
VDSSFNIIDSDATTATTTATIGAGRTTVHPAGFSTALGVSLSEFIDWGAVVDRVPLRRARKDVVPVESLEEFKRLILEEGCSVRMCIYVCMHAAWFV